MKKIAYLIIALVLTTSLLNSCKKEDALPETPCSPPNSPKVTNNSPVNIGDTIRFTTQSISGATYLWKGPNGFTSTLQNPVFVLKSNSSKGEYTVTATVNKCTSEAYHTYVTTMDISASSDIGILTGATLRLMATSILNYYGQPISGVQYNWKGPNSFTSSQQNPTITAVTMAAIGVYSVTATTSNGHVSQATTTVSITPKATIASSNSNNAQVVVDSIVSLTLKADSITGASSYSWTGPNNFTSTLQNPAIFPVTKAAEGTYYVTYVLNGVRSKPASTNIKVKYSQHGCNGLTTVESNSVIYNTVEIGNQCWLKENLKNSFGKDSMSWDEMTTYTIVNNQGYCPNGWHMPNDTMWAELSVSVSGNGNSLKSAGQGTGAGAGTDISGFSALLNIGAVTNKSAIFWSSTKDILGSPRYMKLSKESSLIYFDSGAKAKKYYVRCLKD